MKKLNVAVTGNPNCGKTTLFNLLAGTNYHVANYPGITVERKFAGVTHKGQEFILHDLPGSYSLSVFSEEEKVTRDFLVKDKPDIVLQVVDASNLQRNLYFTVQLIEMGLPVMLALNMVDVAEKRGRKIDAKKLSQKLGVPVIETVARNGLGREQILDAIIHYKMGKQLDIRDISYGADIDGYLDLVNASFKTKSELKGVDSPLWPALRYLEGDMDLLPEDKLQMWGIPTLAKQISEHIRKTLNTTAETIIADYRYGLIRSLMNEVVTQSNEEARQFFTDRVDQFLTHRFFGVVFLFLILYGIYQFVFWFSEYPAGLLESAFASLGEMAEKSLPDGYLKSLVVSGLIAGVGGVLGFAPLIFLMFFVIAILEDSGYMARMAHMLDKIFRIFGLQGSSVLPFIVSGGIAGGCAVPGVMSSRTIKGKRERLITILTAPFMPCGAKLPVFALLVSAFFPGDKALMMLFITIGSWFFALIVAKIYSWVLVKGDESSFILELPPYRFPTFKGMLIHGWEKTWMYIKKAGTIILAISVVLWFLMTFPELNKETAAQFDTRIETAKVEEKDEKVLEDKIAQIEHEREALALKSSFAGMAGSALEPLSQYAGFDWRTNIALIGGFAAKEVVVSTLGTAYSLGTVDTEETDSLSAKLAADPKWNKGVGLALILFTILYAPCFVTVVAISRETANWKWGLFTVVSNTVIAFIFAVAAYQTYLLF